MSDAETEIVQPTDLEDVMSQVGDEVFAADEAAEEGGDDVVSTPAEEQGEEEADIVAEATQEGEEDGGEPGDGTGELTAPDFWDEETREAFEGLDDEAKALMLRVNEQSQASFTRKTQKLAEQGKATEAMAGMLETWGPYLTQLGAQTTEAQVGAIGHVLQIEAVLRTGTPEQKLQAYQAIQREYQIPQPTSSGDDDDDGWDAGDGIPKAAQQQIDALTQRVQQLTRALQQGQTQQRTNQAQQVQQVVNDFKATKGEDGQPKYPHFDTLDKAIGGLLRNTEVVPAGPLNERLDKAYTVALAARPDLAPAKPAANNLRQQRDKAGKKAAAGTKVKSSDATEAAAAAAAKSNGEKWDSDAALSRIYDASVAAAE